MVWPPDPLLLYQINHIWGGRLEYAGCKTPIVADIHFTPKVALVCADFVDKAGHI